MLLVTLDSCRYDSFRRSTTPAMDRVGPLHRAMAPSHFTFGSHAAIFKGFLPSVRDARPLLNSKLAKLFRLAHAGWPGKAREEFLLQGPSIIEGFRRQGYRTVGSGAVGWFDPATETGRCLTAEFERFFYPGSTWKLAEQLAWIESQRQDVLPEQPLMLFLNVGETHVPYWHEVLRGTVMTILACLFSGPVTASAHLPSPSACLPGVCGCVVGTFIGEFLRCHSRCHR